MTGIRDEDMQENGCVQVQNFLDAPDDPDTTAKLDYQFMREVCISFSYGSWGHLTWILRVSVQGYHDLFLSTHNDHFSLCQ